MKKKETSLAVERVLKGFSDKSGFRTDLEDYVSLVITSEFKKMSYDHIVVPSIEQQQYFSSEFVGTHPWPGWHPKSLFSIYIKDYTEAYEQPPTRETQCFLIPEVTASVCRYVAHQIHDEHLSLRVPYKLYYNQSCFRNEIVSKLSERRLREFTQIGLEYMGIDGPQVDVEVFKLIKDSLSALGFSYDQIIIRINDVRLFNYAVEKSKLSNDDQNNIKKLLDDLASARIQEQFSQVKQLTINIKRYIEKLDLPSNVKPLWKLFTKGYLIPSKIRSALKLFPSGITNEIVELLNVGSEVDIHLLFDPGIVRSQEYYNSTVFQIDIQGGKHITAEIGGGGRYDYLINRLLANSSKKSIFPATGFAFSLERVVLALVYSGLVRSRSVTIPTRGIDYVIDAKDLRRAYQLSDSLKSMGYTVMLYYPKFSSLTAKEFAHHVKANYLSA